MTTPMFELTPISAEAASALRRQDGIRYVADVQPGFPCRRCLRDAEVGEELILVSHDPFTHDTPYRSASPIFLHSSPCTPAVEPDELPSQLTIRQLSVRSFDQDEMMIDAAVIDGSELGDTINMFFESEASVELHVHNATRGCFAASVRRR
ncbi:MAG: DUF1203 domain-containing protein [Actinomycetia bacterium]|nr:DUF1203 domain-containing protein [Actinomycetes bacterium]